MEVPDPVRGWGKLTGMKTLGLGIFLAFTLSSPLFTTAQTINNSTKLVPSTASEPLPENPDSAMALARQMNGLDESGTKGWDIRAKYEVYDEDGDNVDSGVYEEIWAGPKRYRRSYAGPNFTQTDYASAEGLYRSGDQEWPKGLIGKVRRLLIQPFDYLGADPQASLQRIDRKIGQANFVCIAKKPLTKSRPGLIVPSGIESYPQDCFEVDKPMLRVSLNPGYSEGVIWNNIFLFQGRFVARDIKFSQDGKVKLTIHLELIQEVTVKGDQIFAPDAGAKGAAQSGRIQGNSSLTQVLYSAPPIYPEVAKEHHVEGRVTMRITVGKDGSVTDVKVIGGPALLRDAAVDAARKWRYEPVLVMGDPVEMDMTLEINFNFAR